MNKICIVKTGSTFERLRNKFGDFEDWIIKSAKIPERCAEIFPVYKNKLLPDGRNFSAVIITGSSAMVTDMHDWSRYTSEWLKHLAAKNIPILGICYGHQLLAQTFGGKVDFHPKGTEVGSVRISLTEDGLKDPLFSNFPKKFPAYAIHSQTIISPPPGTRVLACNSFENFHAVAVGDHIWGVQFHPEFDAAIMRGEIECDSEHLTEKGYDIASLSAAVTENDLGGLLLRNFMNIAEF